LQQLHIYIIFIIQDVIKMELGKARSTEEII